MNSAHYLPLVLAALLAPLFAADLADRVGARSPRSLGNSGHSQMNGSERLTDHEAQDRYPGFTPDGRKIVFESDRNGNWDIFLMNADGSEVTAVTSDPSNERFPMFYSEGTHLIFTSDRGGQTEIYSLELKDSRIERLTNSGSAELFPAWSPDGKYLSFTSDLDLYLLETGSGNIRKFASTEFREVWLRWSNDGKKAVFFSRRDTEDADDEIYVMDFPDGKPKRITDRAGHDFCPAFSPDGDLLAVAAVDEADGRSINIIDLNGNIVTRFGLGFERVTEPNWSPDGSRIVYAASKSGNYDIYVEDVGNGSE